MIQHRMAVPFLTLPLAMLIAACSDTPAPTSPTAVTPAPDGATLKVSAPGGLSPSGGAVVEGGRPVLSFERAIGLNVPLSGEEYQVELYNQNQALIAQWVGGATSINAPQLEFERTYSWRTRALLLGEAGPWSEVATFAVPRPPILAGCEARDRYEPRPGCVLAVAASADHGAGDWNQCAAGSGVACHRFVRTVARELAKGDPNWGLLAKPAGTWQCTLSSCGAISGGYGEDILSYCESWPSCENGGPDARSDLFNVDVILGAGAPGARISWSPIPRAFNRGSDRWSPVP